MDTVILTIVLLVLLALLAGAIYVFVREVGPANARLWLTAPLQMVPLPSPGRARHAAITHPEADATAPSAALHAAQPGAALMPGDEKLRELAEELRGELTHAAGLTRDFDRRLTRMEADLDTARQLPDHVGGRFDDVNKTIADIDARLQQRLKALRGELKTSRAADSPYGQRRADTLTTLYNRLARLESSLSAVVNPMLLPGERLIVPDPLFDDTMEWSNWEIVGDNSFAFAECFNENRLLLDEGLADELEQFIADMRAVLTGDIYPAVQNPMRSPAQQQQMREGLGRVVSAIPPIRRDLEAAFRASTRMHLPDDDDDA